jgi:hypothetical protein
MSFPFRYYTFFESFHEQEVRHIDGRNYWKIPLRAILLAAAKGLLLTLCKAHAVAFFTIGEPTNDEAGK